MIKKLILNAKKMFEEQVAWAKEAGVDFVIAETITWLEEMKIALKAIKDAGLIAVCNFSIKRDNTSRDGYTPGDACKILEDNGADIISTILPMTLPINKEDEECENAWIRNCIAINPGKRKLI